MEGNAGKQITRSCGQRKAPPAFNVVRFRSQGAIKNSSARTAPAVKREAEEDWGGVQRR
jgi:hypothetical protein